MIVPLWLSNNRTLAVKKMGERKNTSFLRPVNLFSTSSYFPVNRLPLRYPWASFACRAMARGVGGDHLSRVAVLSPR